MGRSPRSSVEDGPFTTYPGLRTLSFVGLQRGLDPSGRGLTAHQSTHSLGARRVHMSGSSPTSRTEVPARPASRCPAGSATTRGGAAAHARPAVRRHREPDQHGRPRQLRRRRAPAPPALPAYADITGSLRADLPATDGSQPGDPAKAADAILQALASDKTPLRLALGNDAANMIAAYLDDSRAEFSAWEHVTRSTDYNAQ